MNMAFPAITLLRRASSMRAVIGPALFASALILAASTGPAHAAEKFRVFVKSCG